MQPLWPLCFLWPPYWLLHCGRFFASFWRMSSAFTASELVEWQITEDSEALVLVYNRIFFASDLNLDLVQSFFHMCRIFLYVFQSSFIYFVPCCLGWYFLWNPIQTKSWIFVWCLSLHFSDAAGNKIKNENRWENSKYLRKKNHSLEKGWICVYV